MVEIVSIPYGLPASLPLQDALKKSFYAMPPITAETLRAVYRGENEGKAVGNAGVILDYKDEEWKVHANSGLVAAALRGIDKSYVSWEYVIVGAGGTLIRGTYDPVTDAYTFAADPQSGVITANSLYGCRWLYLAAGVGGADRIIAVGANGTVLIYDSGSWGATVWQAIISGIAEHLMAVNGWPGTPLVAVSYLGGIYISVDNGDTWSTWVAPGELTSGYLLAIDIVSANDMWACGYGGIMLHYDGISWSVVSTPTTQTLWKILMITSNDGYAVGNNGTIIHWNGDIWSRAASPTVQALASIHGITVNRLSIVGASGTTLSYFGDVVPTQSIDRSGIVEPRPLTEEPSETQVFTEEILDALVHNSLIANMSRFKYRKVWVQNTLNQDVVVQIKQNRTNSATGAQNVGGSFTVAATTGIEARWLDPATCGWEPYIFIEAQCAIAPAAGNLNAYITGRN